MPVRQRRPVRSPRKKSPLGRGCAGYDHVRQFLAHLGNRLRRALMKVVELTRARLSSRGVMAL